MKMKVPKKSARAAAWLFAAAGLCFLGLALFASEEAAMVRYLQGAAAVLLFTNTVLYSRLSRPRP